MTIPNSTEINRRLAEFMGWRDATVSDIETCPTEMLLACMWYIKQDGTAIHKSDWNPFELITHAFMVVEKMTTKGEAPFMFLGYYCRIEILPLAIDKERHLCTFYKSNGKLGEDSSNSWKAYAATLSAAISLAVLEARGERG